MNRLWDRLVCLVLGHIWDWGNVGPFWRGVCAGCGKVRVGDGPEPSTPVR